jgi:DNA-binding transcriptional LysR family regulator
MEFFEYFKDKKKHLRENIIKIAGNHTVMNTLMIDYVNRFRQKYPKIKIELQILLKEEAFKRLSLEETDLAIYPTLQILLD